MIKRLFVYRHTLWDMTFKQLKSKYAGSILGIWWSVITPLLLTLSITFVFTKVFKVETPNYNLFVLAGIIPWFFFATALTETTSSFIINSSILKQNLLPREFIPLSCVLSNLFNFLIGLVFLLPLFIISNLSTIKLLPFLFLVIILHFFFVLGLGLLFSITNVFFRDLSHFLAVAFMFWFWITPVFYSLDMLAFPFRWVCVLNPMSYYIILYQGILYEGKMPPLSTMSVTFLISTISFFIGYIIFMKQEPQLLKRI
jgi:ABC-type polysaccharide/polyol phosphate export permease